MTMQVVLGNGEMPTKELTASLQDLWDRAIADTDNFWFLIQAKSEPSATDKALVAWLNKTDAWYATISDGTDVDPIYETGAVETHVAKRLAPKIVELMKTGPEENETAQLLALFVSDDFTAEEDRWLNDVGAAVQDAGFVVRALNDGLIEVDMLDDGTPEEEEEEQPGEEEQEAAEEALEVVEGPDLDEMSREDLIAYAGTLGIEFPPRTRMNTMITAIQAQAESTEEVEAVAEEMEEEVRGPHDHTEHMTVTGNTTFGAPATYSTTTLASVTSLSAPAMMIIVANGKVTSKVITAEQAEALLQ